MPGYKLNHCLQLCFPLFLHDGGPGFRLDDGPGLKLSSVGQCPDVCLWLGPSWLKGFSLALPVCELRAISLFFHSMLSGFIVSL